MRPPLIAQAPPCTAKRIQRGAKSLIYKGGGACVRPAVLGHAAGANEHCLGVAWSARSSIRVASECSKAITDLSRLRLTVPRMERFAPRPFPGQEKRLRSDPEP